MILRRALLATPFLTSFPAVAQASRPLVVASTSILEDMIRAVTGDAVATRSLVPRDGDPHEFQPRPSDLIGLRDAVAAVENGLGLEGWLGRTLEASGFKGRRIVASAGIAPRRLSEGGSSVPDPHVWQDPVLGQQMVRTIATELALTLPDRAEALQSAADAYAGRLREIDAKIRAAWTSIAPERRRVLTTHDAFAYYGARYGVAFIAIEGISPDAEPSARQLAEVVAQARRLGIRSVFLENMTDARLPRALAREAGIAVGAKLYADSLSVPDGPASTYLDLLRFNTAQLVASVQ